MAGMTISPDVPGDVPLWPMFFRNNPYTGFDASKYLDDCGGWNADHQIFRILIDAIRPELIVEVGTWKGASAINMARIARELGLPTRLICIDTWLDTKESYAWKETYPSLHNDLDLKYGWPHLYYQFLSNVCRNGFQDDILPLAQTSAAGLRLLHELGIRAQLIYVDGSHYYDEVCVDLRHAWECLTDDGVLFGDDYLAWDGVTQAVDEFCLERDLSCWEGRANSPSPSPATSLAYLDRTA